MELTILILGSWILISAAGTGIPGPVAALVVITKFLAWLLGSPFNLFEEKRHQTRMLSSWEQREVLRSDSNQFTGLLLEGRRRLSEKVSCQHVLITGATGSGKSTTFFLPNLLSPPPNSSYFVIDLKSELWGLTSGYLASIGYRVVRFAPDEPTSVKFNPLPRATSDKHIRRLCEIILPADPRAESFWVHGARDLLAIIIKTLSYFDPQYNCLPVVRQTINIIGNPDQFSRLIWATADVTLIREWEGLRISTDGKVMAGWISQLRTSTSFLTDEVLASLLTDDNIDMENFRREPTVLYLCVKPGNLETFKPIIAILTAQFIDEMMVDPNVGKDPSSSTIFALLDEFGVYGSLLPSLPSVLALARSYRFSISCAVQDINQIVSSFGPDKAKSLQTNLVTKLFLPGQTDLDTLRNLELTLGNTDRDMNGFIHSEPLMSAAEIRAMKSDQALVISGSRNGFVTDVLPYFKNSKLKHRAMLPPHVDTCSRASPDDIPILNIDDLVPPTDSATDRESLSDFLAAASEEIDDG
jgi:type IV secretion system protein VirD4